MCVEVYVHVCIGICVCMRVYACVQVCGCIGVCVYTTHVYTIYIMRIDVCVCILNSVSLAYICIFERWLIYLRGGYSRPVWAEHCICVCTYIVGVCDV